MKKTVVAALAALMLGALALPAFAADEDPGTPVLLAVHKKRKRAKRHKVTPAKKKATPVQL